MELTVFGLTKGSLLSSESKNPRPGRQTRKLSLFPRGTSYNRLSMDSTKSAWKAAFLLSQGSTLHQEKGTEQRHIKPVFKCSSEIRNWCFHCLFWIYFGSLEIDEGKRIGNSGMKEEKSRGKGWEGMGGRRCCGKMRVPAPHGQVTGAALRASWDDTHKGPRKGESLLQELLS